MASRCRAPPCPAVPTRSNRGGRVTHNDAPAPHDERTIRMDSKHFDSLVESFGTAASRRGVVRGGVAAAIGALGLGLGRAAAAPRTCATCTCGVGRPCNPKSTCQVEVGRTFPTATDACSNRCAEQGFKFCGAGSQFHCPRGCS
jgi:hypothetical protein